MSDITEPSSPDDVMTRTLTNWAMDAEAVQKARGMLRLLPRPEPACGPATSQPRHLVNRDEEGETALQGQRTDRADELAEGVVAGLLDARNRIDDLTSKLLEAHEDQQQAVACLRAELDARTAQLLAEKDARRRTEMELVGAETREMGTKAELGRALADIEALQRALGLRRRSSWWRRLLNL